MVYTKICIPIYYPYGNRLFLGYFCVRVGGWGCPPGKSKKMLTFLMPPEMSAFNKQPSQKKKADIFGVTRNVGPQVQPSQKNADIFDGIRNVGPQQVQPSQKKMPTFWVPSEMSALNKPQVQKKKPTFSMPSDMSALQTKKKCRHF